MRCHLLKVGKTRVANSVCSSSSHWHQIGLKEAKLQRAISIKKITQLLEYSCKTRPSFISKSNAENFTLTLPTTTPPPPYRLNSLPPPIELKKKTILTPPPTNPCTAWRLELIISSLNCVCLTPNSDFNNERLTSQKEIVVQTVICRHQIDPLYNIFFKSR